ncbi:MAG: mechanosensitive ion channel [Candidatus Peribacteraceae bacterium]|nr:mechanosensitive ion channel [Candidatus Peribacteraceae bacterium]
MPAHIVRMKHSVLHIVGIATWMLLATPCAAQQEIATKPIDPTTLIQLYGQLQAEPENTYIQQRIDSERQDIRKQIEEELTSGIAPTDDILGETELPKAVEKQKRVVEGLAGKLAERKADLELLNAEEQQFYLLPQTATGVLDTRFRLTQSHAELLAKRAILEDRIAILDSLLSLNQSKLQKLMLDQRLEQFSFLRDIATYAAILLLIWLLERFVRTSFLVRIPRLAVRYAAVKIFTASVYTIAGLWIVSLVLAKQPGIVTSFAIVGAGIAIALQDVVKDMLGWFMIRQNQLFTQGQRVTISRFTGEVIDIGILRTKLLEVGAEGSPVLERTGKTLSVPNSLVLTQETINHNATSDFLRAEMPVTVTYESNWERAETILKGILEEETGTFGEVDQRQYAMRTLLYYIPRQSRGPAVHVKLGADGIEFTLRYFAPIGEQRPVATIIAKRILKAFKEAGDIELAYKTTRSYSTLLPAKEEPPVEQEEK